MKRLILGSTALIMLIPALIFAQTTPKAPASWVAFQQQESAKRIAFFKQMKAERDAFLKANPDVRAYLEETHQNSKGKAAWRAAHPSKNPAN